MEDKGCPTGTHEFTPGQARTFLEAYRLVPESRAEVCARPGHDGDQELQGWIAKANAAVRVLHS